MGNEITDEKLEKYFSVTGEALSKVKFASKIEVDFANVGNQRFPSMLKNPEDFRHVAEDFLDMATRYYSDAKHFKEKGDIVNAFACLNYAHGWLDAGARLGVFDVGGDNRLFTVD